MDVNDIKEKIEELVEKVTKDEEVKKLFQTDPVKAVEKVLGVDLPDEQVEKIVDGVKAKLTGDQVADAVDALKGLFNRK